MPAFQHGTYISDHRSDFKERWGGWYVTGDTGAMKHMGNSVTKNRDSAELVPIPNRFDPDQYLTPHSDVVALLVLEHQTHMHNFITRLNYESTLALQQYGHLNYLKNATEAFLKYLLFSGS